MTGWQLSELDNRLPANVMRYAVECVNREGRRLAENVRLFLLPAEAQAGGKELREDLQDEALRLVGSDDSSSKQEVRSQEAREQEHIRQILDAEKAGDLAEVERLELEWEAELVERKKRGEAARRSSKWTGDTALLGKAGFGARVHVNRNPSGE